MHEPDKGSKIIFICHTAGKGVFTVRPKLFGKVIKADYMMGGNNKSEILCDLPI